MSDLPPDFRAVAIEMLVADPDLQWAKLTARDASPSKRSWIAWLKNAPKRAPEVKVKCAKPRDDGDEVRGDERVQHASALCKAVGVDPPTVGKVEASARAPSQPTDAKVVLELAERLADEADPAAVFAAWRARRSIGREPRRERRTHPDDYTAAIPSTLGATIAVKPNGEKP